MQIMNDNGNAASALQGVFRDNGLDGLQTRTKGDISKRRLRGDLLSKLELMTVSIQLFITLTISNNFGLLTNPSFLLYLTNRFSFNA